VYTQPGAAKPPEGCGLNTRCSVTLLGVFRKGKQQQVS
jgi:hypothetical protein